MGLSNGLMSSAPTDSIPMHFIAAVASFVSFLRSLFRPDAAAHVATSAPSLAGFFGSNRPFSYSKDSINNNNNNNNYDHDCVICLSNVKDGDRVRRLSCRHVFHCECLDSWFGQMKLTCPLCRSPLLLH